MLLCHQAIVRHLSGIYEACPMHHVVPKAPPQLQESKILILENNRHLAEAGGSSRLPAGRLTQL